MEELNSLEEQNLSLEEKQARITDILSRAKGKTGEALFHILQELKHEEAEIVHAMAKENQMLQSILVGGLTLATDTGDDTGDDSDEDDDQLEE